MQLIDTVLAIGIFIQLTKLSDLLIREHQKKKVQSVLESFTLKLEYTKPLTWFSRILEGRWVKIILSIITTGAMGSIFIHSLWDSIDELFNLDIDLAELLGMILGLILGIGLFSFITWLSLKLYGLKLLNWLIKDKKGYLFVLKFLTIFAVQLFVVLFLVMMYVFSDGKEEIYDQVFILLFAVTFLTGILSTSFVINYVGFVILAYQIILFFLFCVFSLTKWLLWRIVEYNNGAVAGISLILTVALGIISILIKIL
jgi:hypothetical protein